MTIKVKKFSAQYTSGKCQVEMKSLIENSECQSEFSIKRLSVGDANLCHRVREGQMITGSESGRFVSSRSQEKVGVFSSVNLPMDC